MLICSLIDLNEQYANLHSSQPNTSTNKQFKNFITVLYDTYNQHVLLRDQKRIKLQTKLGLQKKFNQFEQTKSQILYLQFT